MSLICNKKVVSFLLALSFVSCTKDLPFDTGHEICEVRKGTVSVLNFTSRATLEDVIAQKKRTDSNGDSLFCDIRTSDVKFHLRSNNTQEVDVIELSDLVPDPDMAALINSNGEIIINDTLYVITPYGTFFSGKDNQKEIYAAISDKSNHYSFKIKGDLYRIGNVYRFDTFKEIDVSYTDSIAAEKEDLGSIARATSKEIPTPNINLFPKAKGSKHTFVGKILQGLGQRKSLVSTFPSNSKRRLNCATFDYNYYFRQSIGVTAKIQHKMWYGAWAKVVSWDKGGIRIGFKDVIIKIPYPDGSSYNELYSKVFSSHGFNPIQSGNAIFRPLPNDPWSKGGNVKIDLGFLPMINISTPSANELIATAYKYLSALIEQRINPNYLGNSTNKTYDPFSPTPREDRERDESEIIENLKLGVPVFAFDAVYVVFPSGSISNFNGENEITFRFFQRYADFMVTWSHTLGQPIALNRIYKELTPNISNPDAKLISGSFYACGYLDNWVGYRLTW